MYVPCYSYAHNASNFFDTFAGDRCERNTNDCTPDVCKNSGTCHDGMNTFTCQCQPGFTGKTCETNINECTSNPCVNGGTCSDGIAQYYCHCTDEYAGTLF